MKENSKASSEPEYSLLVKLLDDYQNKRFDDAEKSASLITEQFPEHPFAWKLLGALLNQTGRVSEALIACQKSVLLDKNNAEAHNNLGHTLYKLDRLEEAESSYRKSIEIDPKNALAHYNLGQALGKRGNLEQSEISYKEAIALRPNYIEAYNNLGIVLKGQGRLEEAEEAYSFAIKMNPSFNAAYVNRGQLFFEKGEFNKALIDFDLCDNERSRARALYALNALGLNQEIYNRIECESKNDRENLRIAAIASFLEERDKKEYPNNFCKNPLDFLYFSSISLHQNDSDEFVHNLIDEILKVNATWEPFNRSTSKGFQSTQNLFDNASRQISLLESIIYDELDSYFNKFENEECTYIQKWPSEKKLVGWHVVLKQHGHQNVHIHPSGWLSGVIYLKVVQGRHKNEGAIEFGLNGKHYSHPDSPTLLYQPKMGDIIFFPSSLHHQTIPFSSDGERIIISFDLKPE